MEVSFWVKYIFLSEVLFIFYHPCQYFFLPKLSNVGLVFVVCVFEQIII